VYVLMIGRAAGQRKLRRSLIRARGFGGRSHGWRWSSHAVTRGIFGIIHDMWCMPEARRSTGAAPLLPGPSSQQQRAQHSTHAGPACRPLPLDLRLRLRATAAPAARALSSQRDGARSRSHSTLADPLTRVRHTSYGSQPECGRDSLSRAFTIAVNSSFPGGDSR
jgi:hypothetical protein